LAHWSHSYPRFIEQLLAQTQIDPEVYHGLYSDDPEDEPEALAGRIGRAVLSTAGDGDRAARGAGTG
jgi:hypothetical protein